VQFDTQIVGRSEEVDRLSRVLDGRSRERLALVLGDAGIGKTRLVRECAAASEAAGVTVVTGGCLPLTEAMPLLPITEALRELSRRGGGRLFSESIARTAGYVAPEIAGLLPELEPSSDGDGQRPVEGWRRERRFAAVRELLTVAGSETSIALVVEDLHWADRTTLDLLTYLVDGGRGGPFAIVVTCRSDEPSMSAATRDWLNAMTSVPGVIELRIEPLSRSQSAQLATSLVGGDRETPDLDALYERAEGNPFFTEQLVAAELAVRQEARVDRTAIPVSLAAMLVGRTHRTTEPARQVLAALAVAGRPIPELLLGTVCTLKPEALGAALEELSDADLASCDDRGWYRPRHALLAEAVSDDLQPVRRRALHTRFAETLAAEADPSTAAEVAAHWAGAGRPEQEVLSAVRAGEFAEEQFAFTEAGRQWRRVVELGDAGVPLPSGLRLEQVYVRAVAAAHAHGNFQEASDLTEQALSRFAADGDPSDVAVLLAGASIYRLPRSLDSALMAAREAVAMFSTLPPSERRAAALGRCGVLLMYHTDRIDEAAELFEQQHAMAVECGALKPTVGSLLHLSVVASISDDARHGEELLAEAALLAQESSDGQLVLWVANHQADHLLRTGNLADVVTEGMAALRRVRVLGHGGAYDAMVLAFNVCDALVGLGRISDALTVIEEFTTRAPSREDWSAHLIRAEIEGAGGRLDQAWDRITQVRAIVADAPDEHTWLETIEIEQRATEIALWRRRPEDVGDLVDTIASIVPLLDNDASRQSGRLFGVAMRAQADRAAQARRRRQLDGLAAAHDDGERLAGIRESLQDDPHTSHPEVVTAAAESATWSAELGRLNEKDTAEVWETAAEAWATLGRPHRSAYCLWRQAESLLAAGRTLEAQDILRVAIDEAAELAPLVARITDLAGRARISLKDGAMPRPTSARPYGLTARELEVLSLLVRGNTNRDIATTLFITEKTASVHVSNILRKLDVTSRVQAAMRAEREDLVPEPMGS
jgi:DNA-binding CsgD family transcriptional regulator